MWREQYRFRQRRLLGRWLLSLAVLAALPLGYALWRDLGQLANERAALAGLESRLTARRQAPGQPGAVPRRLAMARGAAMPDAPGRTRAEPDALRLLTDIEAAWSDEIGLLKLDLDIDQRRARIQLVTGSFDALLGFVSGLQRSGAQVALERHVIDPAKPAAWSLDANLTADWR